MCRSLIEREGLLAVKTQLQILVDRMNSFRHLKRIGNIAPIEASLQLT